MPKMPLVVGSVWLALAVVLSACAPAAPTPAPGPPALVVQPTATPRPVPTPTVAPPRVAPAPVSPTSKPAIDQPRYGGILRLSAREDPPNYDLHQQVGFSAMHPLAPVYNLLVKTDPKDFKDRDRRVPDLAQRWEVSSDGKVWTFYLHQGVKFHDGRPLTSADVKATFERIRRPPKGMVSPREAYYSAIDRIETPDEHTVRFILKYPQASFLNMMAEPFAVIFPKHVLEQKGDMTKDILGTGRFRFREHMRGVQFVVEKNPDYFVKGRPYLDGIQWFNIKDQAAIEAALRTGRIDMVMALQHNTAPAIRKKLQEAIPGLQVQLQARFASVGFIPNLKRKPWDDVRVRRAVTLANDWEEFAQIIYQGDAQLSGFMLPGPWAIPTEELLKMPGFRKPTKEDLAEAKRLLAEAGYPNGFKFRLLVRGLPEYEKWAVVTKAQVARIGLEADLDSVETGVFLKRRAAGDLDAMTYGIISVSMGDPDMVLSRYITGSPGNDAFYSNPKLDRLYEKQSQTMDPSARRELVLEMQRLLMEDPYGVPYCNALYAALLRPNVKNYQYLDLYLGQDMEDVWLAE